MYIGDTYYQLDGTSQQEANCVPSTGTDLEDTSSLGYWRTPAPKLRSLSGQPSGGLSYDTLIAAVKKATTGEVVLTRLYGVPVSTLDDLVAAPRAIGISIDCSVTIHTPFHTGSFTGGHTVGLYGRRFYNGQKQGLIGDPGRGTSSNKLPKVWWPWSLILKAALSRTGGNGINVVYTRDLEGVTVKAKAPGNIRSGASTTSADLGNVTVGATYAVAATLHGGKWTTVDGHSGYGWARLTNGRYVAGGILRG